MPKPSSVPITMPPRVKPGDDVSAAWANSLREAVWRLAMRGSPDSPKPRSRNAPNPFDVSLITIPAEGEGDPTYEISVADGWVNERIPGVNDPPTNATAVHKPANILWGADGASEDPVKLATDRRTFAIEIGQQVSVVVYVRATGEIGVPDPEDPPDSEAPTDPTEILIEAEASEEGEEGKSIYYVPPCAGDPVGSGGEFHYKMAVLRDADATHAGPWLEIFLAGSHLDHIGVFLHENAANPAPSGSGRVLKEYDKEANKYLYRLVKEGGELTVTEEEDGIEVRGNEKNGSITIGLEGESPAINITFEDGLWTIEGDQTLTIPDNTAEGWTGDWLLRDCSEDETPGSIIARLSIENGNIVSVNETEFARPLHATVSERFVQSCCWIDDQAHSHSI